MKQSKGVQLFFIGLLLLSVLSLSSRGQQVYELNVNVPEVKVYSGHLKLGGSNPKGEKIAVNNYYVSINNKPVIPVTGEFHYERYPNQYWDESIKKMKAGGITVISTYVFWNLHEEDEGQFIWTGDKNLRRFIQLCRKNNIYTIVRIGPFCHGEIRNGGYPDWLMGKPMEVRSNDPQYLHYVERWYKEIAKQLQGLYYKNGGPIIGIQIENEYQSSASSWGLTYPDQMIDYTIADKDEAVTQVGVGVSTKENPYASLGNSHMKILKSLAVKAGMDVPLYTATGWGNAAIIPNESLPVTSAYAYPTWVEKRDLSPFFLYKDMHAHPDYEPVRYKPEDYPVFAAELGTGIMSVYTRRPVVVHQSFDALANRCVGSGANGLGYYMYHGGTTPRGRHSFMSEETSALPKLSYDFQAPIGEFGQVREGFHRLKLLHFFLKDFGDLLAPMTTVLPANVSSLHPDNIKDLRYAARVKGNAGFIFLNNFQDHALMQDQKNIQLKIATAKGEIIIPEDGGFDLKCNENVIFPFNFNLNGTQLNYATAQLMTKGDQNGYYVFFTPDGTNGTFSFDASSQIKEIKGASIDQDSKRTLVKCTAPVAEFSVANSAGKTKVLVITKALALKSYMVTIRGKKHMIFSDALVLQNANSFELLSDGNNSFDVTVYPKIEMLPKIERGKISKNNSDSVFTSFKINLPPVHFPVTSKQVTEKKWQVNLPQSIPSGVNDIYLTVDYTGDTGMGFVNGQLVTDEFYKGIPWQIGLRKFMHTANKPKEMVFYFRPMQQNASYMVDLQPYPKSIPDFGNKSTFLKVNNIRMTPQYKGVIQF